MVGAIFAALIIGTIIVINLTSDDLMILGGYVFLFLLVLTGCGYFYGYYWGYKKDD